jgi:hypothetical protein
LAAAGSIDRFNARARIVRQHTPARPARVSDATRAAPCAEVVLSQARMKRVLGAKLHKQLHADRTFDTVHVGPKRKHADFRRFCRALWRTRIVDPLFTMNT